MNINEVENGRCVYSGLEYKLTGRYAKNRSGDMVFEIEPIGPDGYHDLCIWVPITEIYLIQENET